MKRFSLLLAAVLLFLLCACSSKETDVSAMPEDFSFFLRWNVYGVSSYDSESGELIKSDAEPEREKYSATLHLSDEQLRLAWEAVASLDWADYVTEEGNYDPNPGLVSEPSLKLELIVEENGLLHRVCCADAAMTYDSPDEAGQALLTAIRTLQDLLTETPEWQAMPDFTVLFY